jgi:hypothetical protein
MHEPGRGSARLRMVLSRSIQSGAMMMRYMMAIGALCVLSVGLIIPFNAVAARDQGSCEQIAAACESAGFVRGAAREGAGLRADCINPIMQGMPQPPRATKPLPQVDPQLVADCRASNPRFGQARASRQGGSQPSPQ